MSETTPEQLRFPPVAGLSVRGDFGGGTLSSDFGPMLLRGVDQRIGLTERLSAAVDDRRHGRGCACAEPALSCGLRRTIRHLSGLRGQ